MPVTQPQPQFLSVSIGNPIELGSPFYYAKVNFTMPDIVSPRTGQNYVGQPISADIIINLTNVEGITNQAKRQAIADTAAAAYAMQLIGYELARINNL